MYYAVYRTTNGGAPKLVKRFLQKDHNHRAKRAALQYLHDLWRIALQSPSNLWLGHNGDTEIHYTRTTSARTLDKISIYIKAHHDNSK